MALVSPSSAETLESKPEKSDAASQDSRSLGARALDSSSAPSVASPLHKPNSLNPDSDSHTNPIPVPNPLPAVLTHPAPPAAPSFNLSFRPLGAPSILQYSTMLNPGHQNPGYQNSSVQPPGVSTPAVSVTPMISGTMYPLPGQAPLPYGQASNGYLSVPAPATQAALPPGVLRYPGPYPAMVRPGYQLQPVPPAGVIPHIPRLPIPGVRPISPMVTPIVRPAVPILPPAEKPQTTVYVGKIAQTVDNDFLLALLRICGPVKSWKRPQDPSDGKLKEFGFCEFEAAEGVLRALRLLSKLNIDGQELMLNINQATKEYLVRYVEKKTEREKERQKEAEVAVIEGNEGAPSGIEEAQNDEGVTGEKGKEDMQKFGIVTDEDREVDKNALERITNMVEERLKTNPLPPPPPIPATAKGSARSNSEVPSKSKDGDSDVEVMKSDAVEDKNDEETTSENKLAEPERPELSSPDKRRHDRRIREKDRERDLKREKERELERFERERERERVRRERDREMKMREAERLYKDRMKDWEAREREKEYQRQYEKDREKERQREKRKDILRDEEGSDDDDDDSRKRRRRSSLLEERRRKRLREKDEDMTDRLKEDDEIAEAERREIEEQQETEDLKLVPCEVTKGTEKVTMNEDGMIADGEASLHEQAQKAISDTVSNSGHGIYRSNSSEMTIASANVPEVKQIDGPIRKLGFGLVGSGKRTTVPSVFHQEDDEDIDEKKMRPLVPIDYSTEELQAVKGNIPASTANIVAAAEFAKRISTNPKEEKIEIERERNGRSNDRGSRRERDRNDYEGAHSKNENKERSHEKVSVREDKLKTENKKLLDAKQLIDMIPKTKEELFAYEINWAIYDKHSLHERMRPWISKKITEFLGEEEATLVDYIVSSTKEHVRASKMLELLQSILDDEAEMFVLKMWRMLIFEIKKVETGLSVKSKA
ncbi:hypothetical protein AXF42_Ash004778 [Apostasia shenzhenica]|uniref:RNA-binding protein 25 n=1 Tax=Apostasia shenzhenica TaxID=1088818 RepID=A0A2I0BHL6_9ASPA|nr:hypothetical protein AXF42_Ash004778 [Apostasia shenzhenica]